MKSALFVIYLNVGIVSFGLSIASAKGTPTSAEQLRSEVEASLKAKDTNAFSALFNWQGVSQSMKAELNEVDADLFSHDITSVKIIALPKDVQLTNELNGVLYKPNVAVVGEIDVEYSEKGNNMQLPYGVKDGVFYLSGTVEERIATSAAKEKLLNVEVMGSAMPDAGGFSGSYVYVKDGKNLTASINGKGNKSVAFWGDYVKSCTIQKTSDSQDWIKLVILENGKKLFESQKMTNEAPIVYEKK